MTYNGWRNYETWAVKLWMDNEEPSYRYWQGATAEVWESVADKMPNSFMDRSSNARSELATQLKAHHDDEAEHPVFRAADGTVYADLLNAALGEVDWYEIADSLLNDLNESLDDEAEHYTNEKPSSVVTGPDPRD